MATTWCSTSTSRFVDAAFGATLEVPTIDGKVKIKIDPGTQSGKILRLRGKGIKDLNGYNRGDQLIHINVWTPKELNSPKSAKCWKAAHVPELHPQPRQERERLLRESEGVFSVIAEVTNR